MSSSRRSRKPLVTRKVLSDEEEDVTTNDDDSQMTNGHEGKKADEDIPEDLPEGTVVVEPEPVEDSSFKGPEFPSSKKKVLEATGYMSSVFCTACGEQINTSKKGDARRHSELSVLVCRRCYKFHQSGEIKQDEDGVDEYCRWCSEGGKIYGCDFCHNAFCQACIKRNLGRAETTRVKDGDKFKCYVCDPKPLTALIEQCNSVMDQIDKEFERMNESFKKKNGEKQKTANKSDSREKSKEDERSKSSLVIKLPNIGSKQPKTSTPKPKDSVVAATSINQVSSGSQSLRLEKPIKLSSLGNMNVIRHPVSIAPHPALKPQNVIYVEPNKGSAKQLVYVQPKQRQVPTMTPQGTPQNIDPLVWKNVNPMNVPTVTDKLIQSSSDLINMLRTVRMNVQGNSHALSQIAYEGRKTAISIMKSSVDLFLTQLSSVVGTNIVQEGQTQAKGPMCEPSRSSKMEGVKLTGANSSVSSAGEKDLIVLDSENDNSKVEVLDITDSSEKNGSSDDIEDKRDDMEMYIVPMEQDESEINEKDLTSRLEDTEQTDKVDSLVKGLKSDAKKERAGENNETDSFVNGDKSDKKRGKSDKKPNEVDSSVKGGKSDKKDNNKDDTENENDAAHLELLQELQELSGTVEVKNEDKKDDEIAEDSDLKDCENSNEKEKNTSDMKSDKKEKSRDKKDKNMLEKKEREIKKEPGSIQKDKNSSEKKESENKIGKTLLKLAQSESSGSESDVEDISESDNSNDSDFDVKEERQTRRSSRKAAGKEKFKELRSRRQDRERSAKKKSSREREQKKSKSDQGREHKRRQSNEEKELKKGKSKSKEKKKGSDDSDDFNEDLEKEIDNLEKRPVLKKEMKKEEEKKKKEKKTEKGSKVEETSKKGKKKDDLDDLSSTEEDDRDETEENEEDDDNDEPMDQQDDEATEDLSDKDDDDEIDVQPDSSDSEIILSPRKRRELERNKRKGKKGDNSDSETEDEDVKPKKRLRSSLLDAKVSSSESDFQPLKKKQKGKKTDETTEEDSDGSSDSESEFIALGKKTKGGKAGKNKKKKEGTGKKRKRIRKVESSDDEEGDKTEAESDELEEMKKKKKRRKKKGSDESEEGEEGEDEDGSPNKGRKDIRRLMKGKKLADSTKAAAKAEEERRARIAEKQKKYNNIIQEVDASSPSKAPITKQLILERDEKTKESTLEVDKDLIVKLKPHQVEAVEFIWNCTVESLKMLKEDKSPGAGCLLAHCMGLGKTLSVISFLHTMLGNYETTGFSTALIVCPLNTVLNWQHEVNMWLEDNECKLEVFELASVKVNETRARMLEEWQDEGGIMIIGYEMFRNLTQGNHCRSKKLKAIFKKTLVDPGPDFVVCDEGHILKNDASALSKAMNQIKTRRRVVLTGTPLQNNLAEYHCMVSFVKPNLLGTRKEFGNQFVNPIVNGQHTDSSSHDVRLMKRRAHILHEKLAGCVQRKDYSALTKYLPPKHEYVIAVRLAPVQCDLYSKYLELGGYGQGDMVRSKGAKLFSDYQALMRIWTHPWVLKLDEIRQENKNMIDDEDSFIDDSDGTTESEAKSSSSESDDELSASGSDDNKSKKKDKKDKDDPPKESFAGEIVKKWKTRSRGEFNEGDFEEEEEEKPFSTGWWAEFVKEDDQFKMELSGKLLLLFEILRMCEEIGDKVLVFSQSLLSLDIIESYLEHVDNEHNEEMNKKDNSKEDKTEEKDKETKDEKTEVKKHEEIFGKTWLKGQDYLRMDGSTGAPQRAEMAKNFNDPDNYRLRLFIISTKAGGLGINLFAANRVIIFDASWNPSHDVQSIFRVYRFGQEKPVYVYRFLAQGTMEEKIYERQVTKQSLSQRVIDEHQIDRHFDSNDLRELYIFKPDRLDDPNRTERPTPALPKDTLLAELLTEQKKWIVGYHEHDSLLENKIDQELSEEERKAAWDEFENERKGLINTVQQRFNMGMHGGVPQSFQFGFNPGMGTMGMNSHLNQENLLRIVQEMRQKFPHLPQEQLTMQVQNVVRNMISRQLQQQQWEQRRQIEQREIQQRHQLQQLQARIMMQQNEIRMQTQQQSSSRQGSSSGPFSGSALLANALTKGPPKNQQKKS